MKHRITLSSFLLTISLLIFSSCVSLTGFQDGKTVGKDNGDVSFSLNSTQTPDFDDSNEQYFFPNAEIGGRYGVSEVVDLTLRVNSNLAWSAGAKFQVAGDRESQTALSLGAEVGAFAIFSFDPRLWNVQVPLFFSVHPSETFTWYLNPRYVYQFPGSESALSYMGANTGVMFGNKNKYGLDIGYYNVQNSDGPSFGLFQIGLGARFAFGDN